MIAALFVVNGILAPFPGEPPEPPEPTPVVTPTFPAKGQRLRVPQHAVRINGELFTGTEAQIQRLVSDFARTVASTTPAETSQRAVKKAAREVASKITVVDPLDLDLPAIGSGLVLDETLARMLQSEYRRLFIQQVVNSLRLSAIAAANEAQDLADVEDIMNAILARD